MKILKESERESDRENESAQTSASSTSTTWMSLIDGNAGKEGASMRTEPGGGFTSAAIDLLAAK